MVTDLDNIQISILIVSYNTRTLTRQCLLSLRAELSEFKVEVIVADNGSTDGSLEMIEAEFQEVRLLKLGANLGFGAANNRAAALSSANYLLLLNSDTIVHSGALKALLDFAETNLNITVVSPKLLNADGSLQKNCWRFPTLWRLLAESIGMLYLLRQPSNYLDRDYVRARPVDFAIGACLLIRREAFQKIGGFDEQFFMYAEETDMFRRLQGQGGITCYYPQSVITHLGGGSQVTAGKRLEQFYTSQELYFNKYYGRYGLKIYKVIMVFRSILRIGLWQLLMWLRPALKPKLSSKVGLNKWILGRYLKQM